MSNVKCHHCYWQTLPNNFGEYIIDTESKHGVIVVRAPFKYSFLVICNFHDINDNQVPLLFRGAKKFTNKYLIKLGMTNVRYLINRSNKQEKEHLHMFITVNDVDSRIIFDINFKTNAGVWDKRHLIRNGIISQKPYDCDTVIECEEKEIDLLMHDGNYKMKLQNLIKINIDNASVYIFVTYDDKKFVSCKIAFIEKK